MNHTSIKYTYFLYIFLLSTVVCLLFQSSQAKAEELQEPVAALPDQIRDFQTCALVGLKRVPQLQKSKLEIAIRHLDEEDSAWSFFPDLQLSSYYYVSEDDTTISFNAANYRPWEPYYSLQAKQLITQIAMLEHVEATSLALKRLADTFLQLVAFSQIDEHYKNILDLQEKRFSYTEKRRKNTITAEVDLEIAKQTLAYIIAEHKTISQQQEALINGLCITMNLPGPEIFNLEPDLVLEQILGPLERVNDMSSPSDSIELQVVDKKLLLQEKKILLAYSKYMPDFSFGVRSPDVLSETTNAEDDLFFYVGVSLKFWDGRKRKRDITRQKMKLQQMHIERKEVENSERLAWLEAMQIYSRANSEHQLSLTKEKVKSLEVKKKQFDYQNGKIRLPQLIDQQIAIHRASITSIRKELALNRAILHLRHLSGRLLKDTINVSLAKIPHE